MSNWMVSDILNFENGAGSFTKTKDAFRCEAMRRGVPYKHISTGTLSSSGNAHSYFSFKKGFSTKIFLNLINEALQEKFKQFSVNNKKEPAQLLYSDEFYLSISEADSKINFTLYSFDDEISD